MSKKVITLAFLTLTFLSDSLYAAVDHGLYAEEDTTVEEAAVNQNESKTYDKKTIMDQVGTFFGAGAETVAAVVEKLFREQGEPNGYIRGQEAGGAFVFGLRYGHGVLHLKGVGTQELYWTSPTIGFDIGGNASKVFVLVYNLPDINSIYQRFPGLDGSIYFIGGIGVNYVQSGDIILAPMRFGVGWRAGAAVGYMVVTKDKSVNPF